MKVQLTFLALASCLLSQPILAQSSPTGAAPVVAPITPSQRLAADALLNAVYSEESFNELIDKSLAGQLQVHPELKRFETEMRAFMHKYMSWSAIKPELINLYAQEFTEAELVEITRFYQSPVGQKAAAKLPTIMQKGMEIGQRQVQAHKTELEKIFKKKIAAEEHQHSDQ